MRGLREITRHHRKANCRTEKKNLLQHIIENGTQKKKFRKTTERSYESF
jgi:hypothetical protein